MSKPLTTIQILFEEEIFIKGMRQTSAGRALSETRKKLLHHIRGITKTGDAPLMIATELAILQNDFDRYANSRAMESSLQSAINEMEVIRRHFAIIHTPAYAAVNAAFSLPKNRQKAAATGRGATILPQPLTPASPISTNPASMTTKRKLSTRGRKCLAWRKRFISVASCRYWE